MPINEIDYGMALPVPQAGPMADAVLYDQTAPIMVPVDPGEYGGGGDDTSSPSQPGTPNWKVPGGSGDVGAGPSFIPAVGTTPQQQATAPAPAPAAPAAPAVKPTALPTTPPAMVRDADPNSPTYGSYKPAAAPSQTASTYDVPPESDYLFSRVRQAEGTANNPWLIYGNTPFTPGREHPGELARRTGPDGRTTHAAGPGQWQPGTWNGLKSKFNERFGRDPNFSSLDDQRRMSWLNAGKIYPGGEAQLAADIKAGKLNTKALAPEWQGFEGRTATHKGLVEATQQGGVDGALTYIMSSAPGLTHTSAFADVHARLVAKHLARGDVDKAQAIDDMMFRLSHIGTNTNLMRAHQALLANDAKTSAFFLGRAYNFFPDGQQGKFFTNARGELFGQRFDEGNGQPLSGPFRITPDMILQQTQMTKNPQTYRKLLYDEQHKMAQIRQANAQAGMHEMQPLLSAARIQSTADTAIERQQLANQQSAANAQLSANTRLAVANANRAAQGTPNVSQVQQLFATEFPEGQPIIEGSTSPDVQATNRANASRLFSAGMAGNNYEVPPAMIAHGVRGLLNKKFDLKSGKNAQGQPTFGVVDPKATTTIPMFLIPYDVGIAFKQQAAQ